MLTTCKQLKLKAADGKQYATDVADTQTIFRIIQSVPSEKAEPFKQWMAHVASERIDEIQDPERAILRGAEYYRMNGRQEELRRRRIMLFSRMSSLRHGAGLPFGNTKISRDSKRKA